MVTISVLLVVVFISFFTGKLYHEIARKSSVLNGFRHFFPLRPCLAQPPDGALSVALFSAPPSATGTAAVSTAALHFPFAAIGTSPAPTAYTAG